MDDETQGIIDELRVKFEEADLAEREKILNELLRGYCPDCLAETHGRLCHCERDE